MGKRRRKTLDQLLSEKLNFLDSSEANFLKGIAKTETEVLKRVLKILKTLSLKNGRFTQDDTSKRLLLKLKKEILGAFSGSQYSPTLNKFLTDFDNIESLNRNIYRRSLKKKKLKVDLSLEKQVVIESVVDSLSSVDAINANFSNPIRKTITDAVRLNHTFAEAEANLKSLIQGTSQSAGLLSRYSKQIVTDAVNGFDGAVNDTIRDAFELDGFRYVGSLIKDSRQNCKEWVNGSGKFKKFAVREGVFRVVDLPAMIRIAKGRSGWKKETTPSNFSEKRGGYNCRHAVFYFFLTKEQNEKVEAQLAAA